MSKGQFVSFVRRYSSWELLSIQKNDPIPSTGKTFGNNRTAPLIFYKKVTSYRDQVTVREIFQLTGKLCYSAIAVLPANFHCRPCAIQQLQFFQLTFTADPFRGNRSLGSFKKYVRWGGGRGGELLKSEKKRTGQGGVLACVYVCFLKKMWGFLKWSFIVFLQLFLLIIMAVWNIK